MAYVIDVCRFDYLRISNDNNYPVGTYCGGQSGRNIIVTGHYAVITFHSDFSGRYNGYKLIFSFVPGKITFSPKETSFSSYIIIIIIIIIIN